jgi:prefoldin subunit 5
MDKQNEVKINELCQEMAKYKDQIESLSKKNLEIIKTRDHEIMINKWEIARLNKACNEIDKLIQKIKE